MQIVKQDPQSVRKFFNNSMADKYKNSLTHKAVYINWNEFALPQVLRIILHWSPKEHLAEKLPFWVSVSFLKVNFTSAWQISWEGKNHETRYDDQIGSEVRVNINVVYGIKNHVKVTAKISDEKSNLYELSEPVISNLSFNTASFAGGGQVN